MELSGWAVTRESSDPAYNPFLQWHHVVCNFNLASVGIKSNKEKWILCLYWARDELYSIQAGGRDCIVVYWRGHTQPHRVKRCIKQKRNSGDKQTGDTGFTPGVSVLDCTACRSEPRIGVRQSETWFGLIVYKGESSVKSNNTIRIFFLLNITNLYRY